MRIIAGNWRSRRLIRPTDKATRPMPDRVREAVFDMLGSHYGCPGRLPSFHVADVFAGGGGNGLEALSRGAASCVFFERGKSAVQALRQNLATLDVGPSATIICRDAWRSGVENHAFRRFDLVFLDPPYDDSEDVSKDGAVGRFLREIGEKHDQAPLIVLHHRTKVTYESDEHVGWQILTRRKIGSNGITVFLR